MAAPPGADGARWDARIARARLLATRHPAASETLTFYAELAAFQKAQSMAADAASDRQPTPVDVARMAAAVPDLLDLLDRAAPAQLAASARDMRDVYQFEWQDLIEEYWHADAHGIDADDVMLFVVEALLQPFAEARAIARSGTGSPHAAGNSPPTSARCPACGDKPVVGVLREAAQSARRSLVCGLCFCEWPWPRVVCPACGESAFDALSVFRADAFPAARIDACESCRTYVKTIDLSKDGLAVPTVDELAALPLDLWAREQGYAKLRPNLLRM